MFEPLPAKFDFPAAEKRWLAFWDEHEIFEQSLRIRAGSPRFVFYEGPPTANGLPHPGHCLTRAIKDLFPRYRTMCGYLVDRKAGWDTHGLPVEVEVCKELGIHSKEEIEAYGVERFVHKCINSVWRYTREWEDLTRRLGFWVNLEEAYATYHQYYVESVWWSLKTLFERGLLYQGHKVVWWWAQGGTALSSGEVGEGYRTVDDPSVFVKFPLVDPVPLPGGTGVSPVPSTSRRKRLNIGPELVIRQRYLPHWEAGGSTYFVTFRTRHGELSPAERTEALNAIAHFDAQRYLLHAAVVMPDHCHAVLTPLEQTRGQWWPLAEIMHSIKSYSAHVIARRRGGAADSVWMEEYFDRILRTQSDFEEKVRYVLRNPANRGLPEDYEWVWFEDAHAQERLPETGSAEQYGRDARTTPAAEVLRSKEASPNQVRASLLVWTTTPWTLVSNHFAAVHPELEYALVEDPGAEGSEPEYLYIAKALVEAIAKKVKRELRVVSTCKGTDLIGLRYLPPFEEVFYDRPYEGGTFGAMIAYGPHREARITAESGTPLGKLQLYLTPPADPAGKIPMNKGFEKDYPGWRVLGADFVTIESGTGLVHEAPAFGEVDFELWRKEARRFMPGLPLLCAVNPDGTFNSDAPQRYRGRWVKECDREIIRELRDERKTPWGTPLLYHQETYRHEYPFCPRAEDDPLIQFARKSWFVRTSRFKEEFLKNNAVVNWLPEHIKEGRFGDFLRNNVDWALSRERYWGTPLPIWVCEQTGRMEAIGSFAELQAKPGAGDGGFWQQKVAEHAAAGDAPMPEHLRVHKPYIDEWTYDSPFAAGAKMRRVPEVIDCWWDAGSMPFAQWGFPHAEGSIDTFAERFPADFISEAIDQTRGWFYGLLAISTLLYGPHVVPGKPPVEAAKVEPADGGRDARAPQRNIARDYPLPFKTCIVLGLILGEDGLKMSKRKKNYREPSYIFDTYGADAMRWYFFSAQAPWTSVRFEEAAIRDSQREFLVKLYNVLSFFTIYASIDGFDPRQVTLHLVKSAEGFEAAEGRTPGPAPMGWRPSNERTELDRWIITELRATVAAVGASMDRFENYPAAQKLNDFVDALSNWYIRRSRDRFWRPLTGTASADQDKWDAYHTLYGCLRVLSRLIAPFTPFFAETMHQTLRIPEDPISVHLCDYPKPEDIRYYDEALSVEMDMVREISSLGRSARASADDVRVRKVRQPLAQVEIILARAEHQQWLQSHAPLIAEELNVKQVDFTSEADHYVSYKVVPNFKAIGARFRALVPKIKAALAGLSDPAAARRQLLEQGSLPLTIDGQPVPLTPDDVEVRLEAKPGWAAAQGRVGVVVLSTALTPELRDEGTLREFIHVVQARRKELDLPYEARIALTVDAPEELRAIIQRFSDSVRSECLAERIEFASGPADAAEAQVEGHAVRLAVRVLQG